MRLAARVEAHAQEVRRASTTGEPIQPLTEGDPDLTVADAYAFRLANIDHIGAAGHRVFGHKVKPARYVAWLADKLADFGSGVRTGQIVMPGALHRAVDASRGGVFLAEYSQLGAVRVRFDESRASDGEVR